MLGYQLMNAGGYERSVLGACILASNDKHQVVAEMGSIGNVFF